MSEARIGYYVHHHGAGHLTRARGIARASHLPVTGLSSLPRPRDWAGDWVVLPRDDSPIADRADASAGGALHWAPLGQQGFRDRMALIADWITRARPSLFVADVSVEVTMLARLLGVPVAVLAMRGDRTDRPHRAAYDAASLLLAPWPGALPEPMPPRHRAATMHAGAFSRFDSPVLDSGAREEGLRQGGRPGPARVVSVLWGRGGGEWTDDDLLAAQGATPGWRWESAGVDRPVRESLCGADVVVTHAGQNAVAEVAALRRPAVVVALDRPHDEQAATAAALELGGIAVTSMGIPDPGAWPALLDEALRRNPDGRAWAVWSDGRGARRAAAALEAVATGRRIAGGTAVLTLVHGRHDHLRGLVAGLLAGTALPERFVVVALDDDEVAGVTESACAGAPLVPDVVRLPEAGPPGGRLRLAAARNAAAEAAARFGCERAVFLDVDCIPGPALVETYHEALLREAEGAEASGGAAAECAATRPEPESGRPHVFAGAVTYLPPPEDPPGPTPEAGHGPRLRYDVTRLAELRSPHPARPAPEPGEEVEAENLALFWSLSFALTLADYRRIGGFCEDYDGYGGEDTDFAMSIGAAGGRLTWLGGADAYHQHHPTFNPPVQHLHDIVRNANLFAERWGHHPMEGWLAGFAERGLAHLDSASGRWVVSGADSAGAPVHGATRKERS